MDSGSVFICYRREDSIAYAGRLHDRLAVQFGKNRVFMDVDTIQPGEDFVEVVERRIGASAALIAIIGKGWLESKDDRGNRRLDDPDDYVRREIAAALTGNIRVIPALVGGARMPRATDLPADIAALSRRNAIEISDTSFNPSVAKLAEALKSAIEADRIRRETERGDDRSPIDGEPGDRSNDDHATAHETHVAGSQIDTLAGRIAGVMTSIGKPALAAGAAVLCLAVVMWLFSDPNSGNLEDRPAPDSALENGAPIENPVVVPPDATPRQDSGAVPSPTPSPLPAPVHVGGEIEPPTKTKDVRPQYPPIAQSARVQGVVIVEATIGPSGTVQDARVLQSIPLLDAAALAAVRQWEFTPTVLNGVPVPVIMDVTVNFALRE